MRTLSAFRAGFRLVTVSLLFVAAALASVPSAHANSKYAGIVIDAKTGKTLYASRADSKRYPASLTKMMTMYMMFEALERGKITKKTRIRMSKFAASKPPSKLGIKPGRSIAAEHAILALATKSANDVAAAVAEHLGGSEANFGRMMTKKARQLGMRSTTFKNASGLTAKGQLTTARDMARLGIALREHFPQHYHYFSRTSFKYGKARYRNHTRLLGRVKGVDGIKTGYTRASGYNLVSSVQHNRRSIVAVVMGGKSGKSRNAQMQKLISKYLRKASRSKKRRLLASKGGRTSFSIASAESIRLPKRGPVPVFRQTVVAKVEVKPTQVAKAVVKPAPAVTVSVVPTKVARAETAKRTIEASKPVTIASLTASRPVQQIEKVSLAERFGPTPVPAVRPTAELAYVDPVSTASHGSLQPKGWVVQIAATDDRDAAIGLLEKAREKAPGVLGSKRIYTEKIQKSGITLYRARFFGFDGKEDAREACAALKKKKVSCLAVNS